MVLLTNRCLGGVAWFDGVALRIGHVWSAGAKVDAPKVSRLSRSAQLSALGRQLWTSTPCCRRRHRPCHRRCAAARTFSSGMLQSSPQGPDCLELATGAQGKASSSSAVSCTKYRGVSHMDGPARSSSPAQAAAWWRPTPCNVGRPRPDLQGPLSVDGHVFEGWTMPVDTASGYLQSTDTEYFDVGCGTCLPCTSNSRLDSALPKFRWLSLDEQPACSLV